MDVNLIKKIKKDLIELRSQIWAGMSDAQKEQYHSALSDSNISLMKNNLEDYIYIAVKPEVARKLLKYHEKDWEPFDKFNGFYHCLRQTLEEFDNRFEPQKEESEF